MSLRWPAWIRVARPILHSKLPRTSRSWLALALIWTVHPACPGPPDARTPGNSNGGPRTTDAPEDLLKTALGKNLKQYRRRLRRCHELAMAESYRVGGELEVELLVRPMGVVTAVKTLRNTTGSKLLAACVAHVVKSFVFPAGERDHRLPVKLRYASPKVKLTVRLDDVRARAKLGKGLMAKVVLTPQSVTGKRISMAVLRLAPGSALPLLRHAVPMGLHVLKGVLRVSDLNGQVLLRAGESATIAAGRVHGLAPAGTGVCAVLAFFMPAGPEALFTTGKPAAGSAWVPRPKPVTAPLLAIQAFTSPGSGSVTIQGAVLPTPQLLSVPTGRRAVLNPGRKPMHHALLVVAGAFWVTIKGIKLPAEAGMSIYLPSGESALLSPAGRHGGQLVVQSWPDKGTWTKATKHELLRMK